MPSAGTARRGCPRRAAGRGPACRGRPRRRTRRRAQDRVRRQPHHGEHDAEHDADHHRGDGQPDRRRRRPGGSPSLNAYFHCSDQLKRGFVTTLWTSIAARTAMTTTATQRPGWRTGTALIASAVPVAPCVCGGHGLSLPRRTGGALLGGVDLAGLDRARLRAPLVRICWYWPPSMSFWTAPWIAFARFAFSSGWSSTA